MYELRTSPVIVGLSVSPVYGSALEVLEYIKLTNADDTSLRPLGVRAAYIMSLSVAVLFVAGGIIMFVKNKYCLGESYVLP